MLEKPATSEQETEPAQKATPNNQQDSGIDFESKNIDDLEYPARLFEACQNPETTEAAKEKLYDYIYDPAYREVAVANLFRAVRYSKVDGLFDAVVLRDILRNTFNYFYDDTLDQSHEASLYEAARVLDQFFTELRLIDSFGDDVNDDVNYLALKYFQGFAEEFGANVEDPMFENVHVSAHIDEDSYVPFVVQPNQFGVFNEENTELYVLDSWKSDEIADDMSEPMSRLGYEITETDMGTYSTPLIPKELYAYSKYIRQSGTPVRELLPSIDEKEIAAYRVLQKTHFKEVLESEFGIFVEDIPIKEQYLFLNYLNRKNVAEIQPVRDFTRLYGTDSMRTFLSLERGDETLGDDLVAFGQHQEIATTVFRYYGELLNSAERAEALVKEVSDCEGDVCIELGNQVRENIINRAQKDLETAVRANDPSVVAQQIGNYVASAKEYVALLQEVGAGDIESVSSESLTEEEQTRMQELLLTNYNKAYPEPENEAFKAAVAGSLTKSLSNPNTTFRVLRDNGKIVSYNRFDTLRDYTGKEVSYFGSFNADPAYSGVGGVMLEETIKDRLEDGRPMMAHCDPAQAITKKYIEDGFVATGFYQLAGKPSFEIWRSKDSTVQLESKEKSIEDLLTSTEETETVIVREQSATETYPELQNNMGLTRYFTYQGKAYLVFEQLPDNLRSDFTPPKEELKEAA